MRGFFKTFFAALLALAVFTVVFVFGLIGYVAGRLSPKKPDVGGKAVLVIDLGQSYREQMQDNPLSTWGRMISMMYPVCMISSGYCGMQKKIVRSMVFI